MLNGILNILFPQSCPVCQKPSSDHKTAPICSNCWNGIVQYNGPVCRKCGRPLVGARHAVPLHCGDCLRNEPAFDSSRSFGIYDGTLRKAINLLKYHGIKRLSKPLSDIILTIKLPRIDAVIPVPLHEKRLRHREFNQSALIAKNVAKRLGVRLLTGNLVKTKDTVPQVGLSSAKRIKNIRGAFKIRGKEAVSGKSILLVDDVFTTGATLHECSRVLRKTGALEVHAVTLASGLRD